MFNLLPALNRLPAASLWACLLCVSPAILGLTGCQSLLLVSARPEGDLLPERQELQLAEQAYQDVLRTVPKSENAHLNEMLDRVGQRIAIVSGRPDYEWEFILLSGPKTEAFCLPGGKMAIYEGLLPVCANEAGLAALMSYEMAHALKHHGNDRMVRHLSQGSGDGVLQRIRDQRNPKHIEMMQTAYGIKRPSGAETPFTPRQQSEAAAMGLTLMARAGYDPQEAEEFWTRLEHASHSLTSEMLEKPPSLEYRAAQLEATLPRALSVYQGAPQRHGLGEKIPMPSLANLDSPLLTRTDKPSTSPVETALIVTPVQEPAKPTESPVAVKQETVMPAAPAVTAAPAATTANVVDPELTDAPPWSMTAVSVAPAPIVQVRSAELPAEREVAVERAASPVSDLNVGAPTIEGPLVAPAASFIITASAMAPEEESPDSIITAEALPFPSDADSNPEAEDAPAWPDSAEEIEDLSPPAPLESGGWKPHQPSP